jgi:hypothetical protein
MGIIKGFKTPRVGGRSGEDGVRFKILLKTPILDKVHRFFKGLPRVYILEDFY